MGWYCYHNRECLDCGNAFQSEYDTLLMVNDRHLLCDKCGSYNSSEIKDLSNLNGDDLKENGILKFYDSSECRDNFDLDLTLMASGHNVLATYHANDALGIYKRLEDSLKNEQLISKDNFSIQDLLFGDPNID